MSRSKIRSKSTLAAPQLKRHCEEKLRAAAEKVEKIVPGAGGGVAAEPIDLD